MSRLEDFLIAILFFSDIEMLTYIGIFQAEREKKNE